MIQEQIDNINNNKTELPIRLIDQILLDPIYMLIIGVVIGLILSYIFKILFANKTALTDVDLVKEPIDTKGSFGILFQNLGNSDKCKELYKSLMVKVHPDKFSGTDKEVRASELSQELGKYKHNYSKLKELEKIILDEFKNS
tara:strand:- start:1215 stop:1640 length:426 start_codon:yes stop_codon:yes gene_type:complete